MYYKECEMSFIDIVIYAEYVTQSNLELLHFILIIGLLQCKDWTVFECKKLKLLFKNFFSFFFFCTNYSCDVLLRPFC